MKLELLIIDIDGVMTDGRKYYTGEGDVLCKQYNDKDFTAIKRFKASNVQVCFLSGDNWNSTMAKQRNVLFFSGRTNDGKMSKLDVLTKQILPHFKVSKENCIYIGDDIFDIPVLKYVGRGYCPHDAPRHVKYECGTHSQYVLTNSGGDGVIAELYDSLFMGGVISNASFERVMELDSQEASSKKMI